MHDTRTEMGEEKEENSFTLTKYNIKLYNELVSGYGVGPSNSTRLFTTLGKKNGSIDRIFLKSNHQKDKFSYSTKGKQL